MRAEAFFVSMLQLTASIHDGFCNQQLFAIRQQQSHATIPLPTATYPQRTLDQWQVKSCS